MSSINRTFALIGLFLGIAGSGILFIYSNPQPAFNQGVYMSLEDNNVIDDKGTTVKQYNLKNEKDKKKYFIMSRIGFGLLILGFGCQAAPLFENKKESSKDKKKLRKHKKRSKSRHDNN